MKKPSSVKILSPDARRQPSLKWWAALAALSLAACISEPAPLPPDQALKEASARITRILDDERPFRDAPARRDASPPAEDPSAVRFWAYAHPLVSRAMTRPGPNKNDTTPGAAFMAVHPDVHLTYHFIGEWDVAIQKLTVSLAAGDLPDVALVKRGWLARLAGSGLIAPLDEVVPPALLDDLLPVARASVTCQGKVYALPADGFCSVLFYRRDRVAQPPRNWEELRQWASEFSKAPKTPDGAEMSPIGCLPFLETLWSAGGDVCDDSTGRLDSAEAKEALDFELSLRNTKYADAQTLFGPRAGLDMFLMGRCAVTATSSEHWPQVIQAPFPTAFAAIPGKSGPVSCISDNVLVLFTRHANAKRDAIASLLDYLTGFETLGAAAVEKGSAPIRTSVAKTLEENESAHALGVIYNNAKAPPLLPSWNAIEFELYRYLDLAARWQATAP